MTKARKARAHPYIGLLAELRLLLGHRVCSDDDAGEPVALAWPTWSAQAYFIGGDSDPSYGSDSDQNTIGMDLRRQGLRTKGIDVGYMFRLGDIVNFVQDSGYKRRGGNDFFAAPSSDDGVCARRLCVRTTPRGGASRRRAALQAASWASAGRTASRRCAVLWAPVGRGIWRGGVL